LAAPAAADIAQKLTREPSSVLDIGCGSGVWSLSIASRFAGTRVTGLDLPAVLDAFRARATEQKLADRIDTIAGDVHEVAIPRAFDLVVIANVLRIENEERARHIVQRAMEGLRPGGQLLVIDALASGSPEREQARAVYGLHLTMRTEKGRVYSPAEITAWMTSAGLRDVTAIDLDPKLAGPNGALIGQA
jgi:2-polyprenyl-3-methyl-5-hydroxy-6-metoxy-1,4-benzoquinol methylase